MPMSDNTKMLKAFGLRVRKLRQINEMSQEDLAVICQLDRTYISGIERGLRNISLKNICALAQSFGISMSTLLEGIDSDE